ncbi:MAG: 5-formyltetrahydrofolate cyclo-ligase [Alphaproteobacteria bacterium]|nr:5-formyltetrahydrofolate cyclo-ligase [Alphaproteobacteria bacterium]
MVTTKIIEKKDFLRQQMLLKRRAYVKGLSAEDKFNCSLNIYGYLLSFLPNPPKIIACYIPFWDELDSQPFMKRYFDSGCKIALPVITENHTLIFRQWTPESPLIKSSFGNLEPDATASELEPDIFLIPLVAFDARRHRLGYGKGYYDRTLKLLRTTKNVTAIGLAYDMQRVDSIPVEPTDQRLDGIITEKLIY